MWARSCLTTVVTAPLAVERSRGIGPWTGIEVSGRWCAEGYQLPLSKTVSSMTRRYTLSLPSSV